MDLGIKREEGKAMPAAPEGMPETTYPSFSIPDKLVEAFLEAHPVEIEDELIAKVRLKVSSIRMDSYGSGLGLDVLSIDSIKPVSGESSGKKGKDYPNPAVRRMMKEDDEE